MYFPSATRVLLEPNVAHLLKARTMEPEKQPLLANGSETTFLSKQRLCKHVPVTMDTHATMEALLKTVFYTQSVQRGYKEDNWRNKLSSVQQSVRKSKGNRRT
jgi:hypothetical protein